MAPDINPNHPVNTKIEKPCRKVVAAENLNPSRILAVKDKEARLCPLAKGKQKMRVHMYSLEKATHLLGKLTRIKQIALFRRERSCQERISRGGLKNLKELTKVWRLRIPVVSSQ